MNLEKMMFAAGLGCSEHCSQQARFVASLSAEQRNNLAHLIRSGAERRLSDIERAITSNPAETGHGSGYPTNLSTLMASIFGQRNAGLPPDFLLKEQYDAAAEESAGVTPYTGDLTENMQKQLLTLPPNNREEIEKRIRFAIAAKADGNPERVFLHIGVFGIHLLVMPKVAEGAPERSDSVTH